MLTWEKTNREFNVKLIELTELWIYYGFIWLVIYIIATTKNRFKLHIHTQIKVSSILPIYKPEWLLT